MPNKSKSAPRRKSTSIPLTGANQPSLSEPRQQLTNDGQQLLSFRQHADGTPVSTLPINPQLKRTSNASANEPQLLAEIFKPTVEAMRALGLLAVSKTESGRLIIILPTDLFNDDLTLKVKNE